MTIMSLETVMEESEDCVYDIDYCRQEVQKKFSRGSCKFLNTEAINVVDSRFILTPSLLNNGIDGDRFGCKDVHFGNTIFTAPIMVVNHIRGSFDASDVEISNDGKSLSVSDRSRSVSMMQKRASVASVGFSGKHVWYGISLSLIIIITILITASIIAWRPSEDDCSDSNYGNWYVTRENWRAFRPNSNPKRKLKTPVPNVKILFIRTVYDNDIKICQMKLLEIQIFQMLYKKYNDIAYNYVACGDGLIFEGRGFQEQAMLNNTWAGNTLLFAVMTQFTSGQSAVVAQRTLLFLGMLIAERKLKLRPKISFLYAEQKSRKEIIKEMRHWAKAMNFTGRFE